MTSRLNTHDEDEFEILLSREDYQELRAYEAKLKDMEGRVKIREGELGKERDALRQEITLLRKENKLISSQCERVRAMAQKEYIMFSSILDQLLKTCNIHQPIPKPTYDPPSNRMNPTDITLTNFHIIQTTLSQMSKSLSSLTSPIQSLLTGNKLIHQALIKQHSKTDQQLEQLQLRYQKINLQKSTLEKQYKFQLAQLTNDLQQQKANTTQLERQISQLRRQNTQLIGKLTRSQTYRLSIQKDNDLLQQQNTQLHNQVKQLQEDNTQCQQHIKILKSKQQRHQLNTNQQQQRSPTQKSNNNNNIPNKFQKESFIKETLVEYAREIKNNLISIGTLSQDQIKEIGVSELKMLVEFIHELEEDFE